ncbi:MAG: hypothetical protein K1W16_04160 [Lachnospiraceae bacterium]
MQNRKNKMMLYKEKKKSNHRYKRWISCLMLWILMIFPELSANAVCFYESDGIYHREGYIFVGESHVYLSAAVMNSVTDLEGYIEELNDVRYFYKNDKSISQDQYGNPNTMYMKGNLFFVYEGLNIPEERSTQLDRSYIYSDGKGARGRAVQKIHDIMNGNPNIEHWNIISFQGALEAKTRSSKSSSYYVKSYRNWIDYEFPDADCYFISIPTLTGWYDHVKDANAINNALAQAFPEQYLDYTAFLRERYPQEMIDPTLKTDDIHWNNDTYIALTKDVLRQIQERRGIDTQTQNITVFEMQAVLYTNDKTVIYLQPNLTKNILLPSCSADLPVQVTGKTENGFYQIMLDQLTCYVPETGLSEKSEVSNGI